MSKGKGPRSGGLVKAYELVNKRSASARHQRRKAQKLAKRYPGEVNRALQILEDRE